MALTFPTTGFTGTEVEAFETAYKELAEAIYDDYINERVDLRKLKLPFHQAPNIKLFLEYGLLFAAFIIKQRANNSGSGTNYDFSGSPRMVEVPEDQQNWLIDRMGCISDRRAIISCLMENGVADDPFNPCNVGVTTTGAAQNIGSLSCKILQDLLDDIIGDDFNGCNDFEQKYENPNNNPDVPSFVWETLGTVAGGLGYINMQADSRVTFDLHYQYSAGSGNTHTTDDLGVLNSGVMRKMIADSMRGSSNVTEIPCDTACQSAYGMNAGENLYVVEFIGKLNPIFGTATIITDGFESSGKDVQTSNILNARDDYDFKYGWEIERSGTGTVAGDEFTDDMIRDGVNWTMSGTLDPNMTVCEAVSLSGGKNSSGLASWIPRYTIGSLHGQGPASTTVTNGKGETGTWRGKDYGKPFAVNWSWR